jgi:hypothetical protein
MERPSALLRLIFRVAGFSSSKSPNVWKGVGMSLRPRRPEGPQQISPGQGNVSYTRVCV